jgi:hypothetical protein
MFKTNPFVIGYDLRNEIRPVILNSKYIVIPYWGGKIAILLVIKELLKSNGVVLELVDWQKAAQT